MNAVKAAVTAALFFSSMAAHAAPPISLVCGKLYVQIANENNVLSDILVNDQRAIATGLEHKVEAGTVSTSFTALMVADGAKHTGLGYIIDINNRSMTITPSTFYQDDAAPHGVGHKAAQNPIYCHE
ncbi:hypothetical protein KYT24_004377 [Salmonella enterica]|nr:hypothetical protein [Salmonella enterica]